MNFSEKVRTARLEAGLTQKELALTTGIALRTIQNYESGERMPKKKSYYSLLATALGMEEEILLDEKAEFVLKAGEMYGPAGQRQAEELVKEVTGLFAGGELEEEDKEAMFRAIQDAYWMAKDMNRRHTPKKYREGDRT
ncbi:MAG: helix-turn-helix transcriptional regulator [Spirochaetales bacterium]|nr:helix-turn-helix transcriptional regulator [Candidatus Physcosoma equi]